MVWSKAWTLHLPQCSAAWAYQMRLNSLHSLPGNSYRICLSFFFLMTNWEQDVILNTSDCWFSLPHFLIKFYLISLSILINCLLDNVWILSGEVTCLSLIGVKGLLLFPRLTYQLKPNSMESFIFWHGHKDLLEVELEFFSASFLLICNKSSTNVELLLLSVFCWFLFLLQCLLQLWELLSRAFNSGKENKE